MQPSAQGLVLGPEQLGLLWTAFDDCWDALKVRYAGNEQTMEVGRLRLANALLAAYQDGVTDRDGLKDAGIRLMRVWEGPIPASSDNLFGVGVSSAGT
jgi:hypothetical protein